MSSVSKGPEARSRVCVGGTLRRSCVRGSELGGRRGGGEGGEDGSVGKAEFVPGILHGCGWKIRMLFSTLWRVDQMESGRRVRIS